jgi:hypothetical protein
MHAGSSHNQNMLKNAVPKNMLSDQLVDGIDIAPSHLAQEKCERNQPRRHWI